MASCRHGTRQRLPCERSSHGSPCRSERTVAPSLNGASRGTTKQGDQPAPQPRGTQREALLQPTPGANDRPPVPSPLWSSQALKLWNRFRPPRRLKFTREGKFFVGITLGVGFAAINTANNLL